VKEDSQKNVHDNPYIEVSLGSHEVQGKMGMGTGCLLTGKAEFFKEGALFDAMKAKCSFTNRVWSLHRKRANRRFNKKRTPLTSVAVVRPVGGVFLPLEPSWGRAVLFMI
ncbi:hypothetical protein, partial [Megasphaera massiliensis]|uniref:hypothetical protein n=1 Tax=Megasphaera massiliensis TaxID=1232428 RepID=UPI0034A31D29